MSRDDSGRWLQIGRVILFGYAAILITISLAGAVMFPAYARLHAAEFTPNNSWTPALVQAGLAQLDWPATVPAYIHLGLSLMRLVAGVGVALLLLWRRPASWYILYLAFVLVSFGGGKALYKPLYAILPGLLAYSDFIGAAGWQFFFILFYFFPNGYAVPRWTRWLAFTWLGLIVLEPFFPAYFFNETSLLSIWINNFFYAAVISALGSQFYRYFRRSNAVQRQQTKWIVAVLILMVVEVLATGPWLSNLPTGADLSGDLVRALAKQGLDNILFAMVPLAILVAILRYRLWDIDLVIRRTLAYGAITAVLALIYLGGVTLFQQIVTSLTGQNSPLAVVLSTLLVAALFTPLRRRVQTVIDQRFYRRKYNAEQAAASFSAAARSEVELEALGSRLATVVQEALEPESVSLWLKKQERQ